MVRGDLVVQADEFVTVGHTVKTTLQSAKADLLAIAV
jgi:hypothetical protein